MEFEEIKSSDLESNQLTDERLHALKQVFHDAIISNDVAAAIISQRLDDERGSGQEFLSETFRVEPTYYKDGQGRHTYGISLTRLVSVFDGVASQPDPLEFGVANEATGGFALSPRLEDLLRRTGHGNQQDIIELIQAWQAASVVLNQEVGNDALPDPHFCNTYRLVEEVDAMADEYNPTD